MDEYLERDDSRKATSSTHTDAEETAAAAAVKQVQKPSPNKHLGLTAASHLEMLGNEMLHTDAPLLLQEYPHKFQLQQWINTLMTLATKCVATVNPNVKNEGDLMDIRPYCKLKVIPGGSLKDCAYLSGILFRKHVSHKRMAKEIVNPRIMLLSGGIEFTARKIALPLSTLAGTGRKVYGNLGGQDSQTQTRRFVGGTIRQSQGARIVVAAKVVLLQHVKST